MLPGIVQTILSIQLFLFTWDGIIHTCFHKHISAWVQIVLMNLYPQGCDVYTHLLFPHDSLEVTLFHRLERWSKRDSLAMAPSLLFLSTLWKKNVCMCGHERIVPIPCWIWCVNYAISSGSMSATWKQKQICKKQNWKDAKTVFLMFCWAVRPLFLFWSPFGGQGDTRSFIPPHSHWRPTSPSAGWSGDRNEGSSTYSKSAVSGTRDIRKF